MIKNKVTYSKLDDDMLDWIAKYRQKYMIKTTSDVIRIAIRYLMEHEPEVEFKTHSEKRSEEYRRKNQSA